MTHPIGTPWGEDKPTVFALSLEDHIDLVDPAEHKITNPKLLINISSYFVTSGDAVLKAKQLAKDLENIALTHPGTKKRCTSKSGLTMHNKTYKGKKIANRVWKYLDKIWEAHKQTKKLIKHLEAAKGDACFLETEWQSHQLLCVPKNPRSKQN